MQCLYCNKVVLDIILDTNFNISAKTNTSLTNVSSQIPNGLCLLKGLCLKILAKILLCFCVHLNI